MQNKYKHTYIKNSIVGLLIASFLIVPFGTIEEAHAQSARGFVSGAAVAALPLCAGKIKNKISLLFIAGGGSVSSTALSAADLAAAKAGQAILKPAVTSALNKFNSISTYDENANIKLDTLNAKADATQKSIASIDENDVCLKNIGRLVIKMMLQKLTLSMVAWINSGFDGKPAFIQDPGKFFNDIAKNEILQFGLEINNPDLFPFGKAWLQNQALAFNQKFTDNARYSLNEMIADTTPQYTAQSFQLSFDQGGWGAWSAMTQYPQNNPLGWQLMASDELQKRLAGTQQSTAQNVRDALQAANGFLGDLRCVDSSGKPTSVTQQQKKDALAAGKPDPCLAVGTWQYVTPGKLIAQAATNSIDFSKDSLLKAEDLNDAMAAMADAVLNHFATEWITDGYTALADTPGADGSFVYNPDSARPNYTTQTEKDFTPVQLSSSWLAANPNFNIRTDLTQALIDEQRAYADKLQLQNKELNSTTDGKDYKMDTSTNTSNAYGLVPAIDQLDYCIPGPHPGWEDDSRQTLDAVTNLIEPITKADAESRADEIVKGAQSFAPLAGVAVGTVLAAHFAAVGGTLGSVIPVAGTVVGAAVGALVGWGVSKLFGSDPEKTVRQYFATRATGITGVAFDYADDTSNVANNIMSKQNVVQALNVILERYINLMHAAYNVKVLPEVSKAAATEYNKLQGYAQIISNNNNKIYETKSTVNTLGTIKDAVTALNQKRAANQITDEEYEDQLKPQINAFGRLSADMVNGDDIAEADNLLKQIIDEKNYIYKDLIKGPFGCEQELSSPASLLPDPLYQTKRMDYPFPILYTYDVPAGGVIPDPLGSGIVTTTSTKATYPAPYGPGFLSAYSFQVTSHRITSGQEGFKYNDCIANSDGTISATYTEARPYSVYACEIRVGDVLPLGDEPPVPQGSQPNGGVGSFRSLGAVGSKSPGAVTSSGYSAGNPGGPFEYTIGVY